MPDAIINGLRHHYEDQGQGTPIVFLHGANGSHHQFTEEHTPGIATKFRCIVPDARGLGGSEHVPTMPPTAWVDDLLGLMDHLELPQAHIMGSSRGSRVALRFAVQYPERVKSLLLDGAIVAMTEAGDASLNRLGGDPSSLPQSQKDDLKRRHGDDWQNVYRNYFNLRNLPGLQDYLNTRDEVHKIACPVLVMHGDTDDGTHPLSSTLELIARIPRARLAIIPNIGYSVNRDGHEKFAPLIMEWVELVESGAEIKGVFSRYDSMRDKISDIMTGIISR